VRAFLEGKSQSIGILKYLRFSEIVGVQEGPEECHDKVVASLVDVPEEACDLNPQAWQGEQQRVLLTFSLKKKC
jgi:hypothetical protein